MRQSKSPSTYTGKFAADHRRDTEWVNWRCWFPFIIATVLIGTVLVGIALWWGGYAFFNNNVQEQSMEYLGSGYLNNGVRLHKLSAAGSPVQITLLADLSTYNCQLHTIVSTTNQPHTVVIEAGGASWDKPGSSLTATFGGSVNDGFTFRVVSETQIYIENNNNVAFS